MKTVAITAVMALLVAIPLILRKKRLQPIQINRENGEARPGDENRRYAIDDFLT